MNALALAMAFALGQQQGFVRLPNGHELYVDAQVISVERPWVVLVNGLGYETSGWDQVIEALGRRDYNLVRYDPVGMGKTLERAGVPSDAIRYEDQVEDLGELLEVLQIPGPVVLVGLSYGGGIATVFAAEHPERIHRLVLLAPYTQPLQQQDSWIRAQVANTRLLFPFNPASDDELYDYYLRELVYTTFPAADPSLVGNPVKTEAVFRLSQGIRKLNSARYAALLPLQSVHLVLAEDDPFVTWDAVSPLWEGMRAASKLSRILIQGAKHDLPQDVPGFVASWLKLLIQDDPRITGGASFVGFPAKHEAKAPGVTIPLDGELR